MSLVSIDQAWEEEARIEQQHREWRAGYKVLMSLVTDGALEILNACPNLNPYAQHPKDEFAFVNEVFPKRIKGSNWWDVDVRWSTDVDFSTSPLSMPAQIEFNPVTRVVPQLVDVDGNPIVNTAWDLYTDPVPEGEVTDLVIAVTKNLQTQLPSWTTDYVNTVNSDAVTIRGRTFPAGTLYFTAPRIGPDQNVPGATETVTAINGKNVPFCQCQYELNYRAQGWTLVLPNWGYTQLVPVPGQKPKLIEQPGKKPIRIRAVPPGFQRVPILIGPAGDYPRSPVFLDVNGQAIANPSPDQIIFLEYDLKPKLPFSKLPLK